ncbi:glycerol-3-phosphate transporter subunit; membrane component of ABC superfamily [Desulfamplus magnetovallimortis]|uniref:sn-glycerol-3-phosphate transport system permease protein UgpE n=1 Tax=Desulfamplus magnetovallimortis TaxID=1246637 RepID=A0A1W1H7C3_9BACT|nr:ABC transporter permease subunit [Desulfamplus magnetovallimortis]SLM28381.1 glycerol-3-phosphate transporter subunit; membrane component of ABC superfamily [Desulfamplus magnetovallimortis]
MVEKTPILDFFTYIFLITGILIVGFPIIYSLIAATQTLEDVSRVPMPLVPGDQFFVNMKQAWSRGDLGTQIMNSFLMATGITVGKIAVSILGAFSIVYFDYRFRAVAFASVFCTLMLPVEVRIMPTYEVAANVLGPVQSIWEFCHLNDIVSWFTGNDFEISLNWSLLDSYTGLILPLVASATCTFLFRQFFLTVPEELCEAAKMDGASPMTFFRKILLPLSRTNIAALVVIEFVYGYNQYLWPLLITTNPKMTTAVIGLQNLIPQADDLPEWNLALGAAVLVMLPPVLVVLFMQRWFVKGLIEREK